MNRIKKIHIIIIIINFIIIGVHLTHDKLLSVWIVATDEVLSCIYT